MKKSYTKISQDTLMFEDNKVVFEIGEKSILVDSNENKTTISMTANSNFKENPFNGVDFKTLAPRSQVSYKKVYSKSTHETQYSMWNHNSVVYKYN